MKIVAITGSNNPNSNTRKIVNKTLERFCSIDKMFTFENIFLGDYSLNYCVGCGDCFNLGYCNLDKSDDMGIIREKLHSSDIILFASPVYAHSISGVMKTLIDRSAYQFHILNYSKKLGFTLSVTNLSGSSITSNQLKTDLNGLGVKVLDNFNYIDFYDSIDKSSDFFAKCMIDTIEKNYGFSSYSLEKAFVFYKDNYYLDNKDEDELYNENEYRFWNQDWIKEIESFQEFAMKRSRKNDFITKQF